MTPKPSRQPQYRFRCSLSVHVLSVKSLWRWHVVVVGGGCRVRADAQPYLGPRSGVAGSGSAT